MFSTEENRKANMQIAWKKMCYIMENTNFTEYLGDLDRDYESFKKIKSRESVCNVTVNEKYAKLLGYHPRNLLVW